MSKGLRQLHSQQAHRQQLHKHQLRKQRVYRQPGCARRKSLTWNMLSLITGSTRGMEC